MSYQVAIQEKQDYIRAEVSGERVRGQEASDSKEFWLRMANLCNEKGVFRILVISNLSGTAPVMAGHELGTWIAKNELLKKIKTAVVDLDNESRKTNLFVETVAGNRSRYDIAKVFGNEEDALEWLLK